MLEQAAILEDKYNGSAGGKKQFCVSTQHYSFAVNAFEICLRIRNGTVHDQQEQDAKPETTATGTNAHWPKACDCSMAGISRLQMEAATMTPAANPVKAL